MKKKNLLIIILIASFCLFIPNVSATSLVRCGAMTEGVPAKFAILISLAIKLIKYLVPVIIIIIGSIDIFKAVTGSDSDMLAKTFKVFTKRLIAGALVFLIVTIFQTVISLVAKDGSSMECVSCFISNKGCEYYEDDLEEPTTSVVEGVKNIKEYVDKEGINIDGITIDTGEGVTGCKTLKEVTSEPNPSIAINYWKANGENIGDFVYPTDKGGQLLGAWPANHNSIPTSIKVSKTYLNGNLMFPVDVTNHQSYPHSGIDLHAPMGTPIYSPVSGTLMYSEWGHTVNKGCDETAYTVTIILDKPIVYKGVTYSRAFLTHMTGIVYRCSSTATCGKKIKQGDLVGFVGNAVGTSTGAGFIPHLHLSLCANGCADDNNIWNEEMNTIYGLTYGQSKKAGQ